MDFNIRLATKGDMPSVLNLIKALAIYEKEPEAVLVTAKELEENGFGNNPLFTCFVAEKDTEIIGIALCYLRFSTWKGKTLHLEDLIVTESYRGSGAGGKLLDEVIKLGHELKVRRICWEVLDWNTNAIAFYEKTGAAILKDWYLAQMDEKSIDNYINSI
jgi:GNAT superfamily N-acetyltransferase